MIKWTEYSQLALRHARLRLKLQGRNLAVLAGFISLLLIVAAILLNSLKEHAALVLQGKLRELEAASQLPLTVGSLDVSFTGATLEDVVVGEQNLAVFDKIEISTALNPFSAHFGKAYEIRFNKASLSLDRRTPTRESPTSRELNSERAGQRHDNVAKSHLFQRILKKLQDVVAHEITVADLDIHYRDDTIDILFQNTAMLFAVQSARFRGKTAISAEMADHDISKDRRLDLAHVGFAGELRDETLIFQASQKTTASTSQIRGSVRQDLQHGRLRFKFRGNPIQTGGQGDISLNLNGNLRFEKQTADTFGVDLSFRGDAPRIKLDVLSSTAIGPVQINGQMSASLTPSAKVAMIRSGKLQIGKAGRPSPLIEFTFGGLLQKVSSSEALTMPQGVTASGFVHLTEIDCDQALAAIPPNFVPALSHFDLAGNISATLEFSFDTANLSEFSHTFHSRNVGCSIRKAPASMSRAALTDIRELSRTRARAPTSESQVYYVENKRTPLIEAFSTAEDAAFWKHQGIDEHAIEVALRRNLADGGVSVGGSTITMQTAKNLFLSHERTISRKFQEVVLAWHLESILSKQEILQLYLNIIEFGPNIYGISNAARHFFDKDPQNLNLLESAYLASVLPSPVRRYKNFCRTRLSENYRNMIDQLLKRMLNLGRISAIDYETAIRQEITFSEANRFNSLECQILSEGGR